MLGYSKKLLLGPEESFGFSHEPTFIPPETDEIDKRTPEPILIEQKKGELASFNNEFTLHFFAFNDTSLECKMQWSTGHFLLIYVLKRVEDPC